MANFEDLKEIRQDENITEEKSAKNKNYFKKIFVSLFIFSFLLCLFATYAPLSDNTIFYLCMPFSIMFAGFILWWFISAFKEAKKEWQQNRIYNKNVPKKIKIFLLRMPKKIKKFILNVCAKIKQAKNTLKTFSLVALEIIYYGALFCGGLLWVYNGASEPSTPFWGVCFFYIVLVSNNKSLKASYKNWEWQAEHDEFYKRFVNTSKIPLLLPQLLFLFVFTKYFDTIWVIAYYFFLNFIEVWDRRFNTNNIKQDLILEKLEKILPKH